MLLPVAHTLTYTHWHTHTQTHQNQHTNYYQFANSKQFCCCHWIQSLLATTYSFHLNIYFCIMRCALQIIDTTGRRTLCPLFDHRTKWKSILWRIQSTRIFPNPLLSPRATCAHWCWLRINFCGDKWICEESKWCVANQWISYYRHRSKLNASVSFTEKINIFFLNFTLDKEKRMNFLSPSRCTRAHQRLLGSHTGADDDGDGGRKKCLNYFFLVLLGSRRWMVRWPIWNVLYSRGK